MISIELLHVYMSVVDTKSFTLTANRLGVMPSSVSRQMNMLEQHLDTKLFNRTTRKIQLTEAGHTLAARLPEILKSLDDTFGFIGDLSSKPKGLLRITAPVVFSELYLHDMLMAFRKKYPEVTLDIHLSEGVVDIVEEGFDVAVRIGKLADSNLRAVKIANNQRDLVIAPVLEANLPPIATPEDITDLPCLTFRYKSGREIWQFKSQGHNQKVAVKGPLRANNSMLLVKAAIDGEGLALCPRWLTEPYLKNKSLNTVLEHYDITASDFDSAIYLVYPDSNLVTGKVRAFIDFTKEYFSQFAWAEMHKR
ncbi:LysR family transcriptional regulator [Glaciecola sp. 2405UD65-10]|uniref:LysR family transcriptional regulator n=1 Tax=Glaciecola sp. 2405UD65-10 TaxID=3397244 RepID=UPI003B5A580D